MEKEIVIILPDKIPVLRDSTDKQLKRNVQEFNIYFKNRTQRDGSVVFCCVNIGLIKFL